MAKKIEWTLTSIQDRFRIYHFWIDNNRSVSYSNKLELLFNEAAKLISEFPEIGTETDYPDKDELEKGNGPNVVLSYP